MLGAIIGDMVGSIYEFHPSKTKQFNIYNKRMRMTDDSYLTIAVAKTIIKHYPIDYSDSALKVLQADLAKEFIHAYECYPRAGYGALFYKWCRQSKTLGYPAPPYNSYGNGSAMRISPVSWVADSEEHLKLLVKTVTEITHNHIEGLKGAEAVSMCIYLALKGASKDEIRERMIADYYPEIATLDFDQLVKDYRFFGICQKSVPQAIYCFLISNSLEDAIRNCVAIGGDCDTLGAMAGAISEAYYSPKTLSAFEDKYLYLMIDPEIEAIIKQFHQTIGSSKFNGEINKK